MSQITRIESEEDYLRAKERFSYLWEHEPGNWLERVTLGKLIDDWEDAKRAGKPKDNIDRFIDRIHGE
jgi:hypothetical protein